MCYPLIMIAHALSSGIVQFEIGNPLLIYIEVVYLSAYSSPTSRHG